MRIAGQIRGTLRPGAAAWPELPTKFAGCWKRKRWVRRYKAAWQRWRRGFEEFRRAELDRQKRGRKEPKRRRREAKQTARWKREHKPRVRKLCRDYRRRKQRLCFFCGSAGRRGPGGGTRRVKRLLPNAHGVLRETEVNYCGRC